MTRGRCVGMWVAAALATVAIGRASARAESPRYAYVPLDQVPLPAPYAFFAPAAVVNGRVYGTVFDEDVTLMNVAV